MRARQTGAKYGLNSRAPERGAYLPIVAIGAFAILLVLVGLGMETSLTKSSAQALNRELENICRSAASRAVVQRDAVQAFSNMTNVLVRRAASENILRGARLVSARIVVPTMPDDGQFCAYGEAACAGSKNPAVLTAGDYDYTFSEMGIQPHPDGVTPNWCGSNCVFRAEAEKLPEYPALIWSNVWNAGNTAACEMEARVRTSFFGERSIHARAVWWLPVRGEFDLQTQVPGLTIAIAPHMTTRASDPRFRFCSAGEANCGSPSFSQSYEGGDNSFRNRHDPLWQFSSGATPGLNGFGSAMLPRPYTASVNMASPDAIAAGCRSQDGVGSCDPDFTRGIPGANHYDYGAYQACPNGDASNPNKGVSCLYPGDREEMLAACMNPAILLRNIFLAQILEHASRHGQLRMGTEVLLVGTQSRVLEDNSDQTSYGAKSASPSLIVPFQEDLALGSFQLPYVFYDGGEPPGTPGREIPVEFGRAQGGWINPFDNGLVDPALRPHHALVAAQLRACYHLFFGPDQGMHRVSMHDIENHDFEPPLPGPSVGSNSAYYFSDRLRPLPYLSGSGNAWDQECPWATPCAGGSLQSRGLNAAEVVSILGAVQKCPYEQRVAGATGYFDEAEAPTAPAVADSGVCLKSAEQSGVNRGLPIATIPDPTTTPPTVSTSTRYAAPTLDLRPDLYGLMLYLARQQPPGAGAPPALKAIKAPGIFPVAYGTDKFTLFNTWYPMGEAKYELAPDPAQAPTAILIFTHQRIGPAERDHIRALIDSGAFNNRPITLVYMPVEERGNTELNYSVRMFRDAFHIRETSTAKDALFVLSPHLTKYQSGNTELPDYRSVTLNAEWQRFRSYWHDLMTSSSGDDIYTIARNIFYKRILREDIKF